MSPYQQLHNRTKAWAEAKGILSGSSPLQQLLYTASEFGELIDGVLKQNREAIMDAIGDMIVTLDNHASLTGPHEPAFWEEVEENNIHFYDKLPPDAWLVDAHKLVTLCLEHPETACDCYQPLLQALAEVGMLHDLTLAECWEHALGVIEQRTGGAMVDGVYDKDA